MNINVFSWLLSFFKLRERVVTKFGCNGKMSQSYLSYFLTGFHWRISLPSRANRLCTVFNAGLKDFGVPRVSVFLSLARSKMAIVRLPPDMLKNYLFFVFTSVEGKGTPLPFGVPPPIIWLHFLLPLPMSGDPRSLRCEHLCDPHSLIMVTFWLLDNVSSTGGSIIPTSSSPWAITWHNALI